MHDRTTQDVRPPAEDWLAEIERRVRLLRYGQITVTIHDGRVVQMDVSERMRFDTPAALRRAIR